MNNKRTLLLCLLSAAIVLLCVSIYISRNYHPEKQISDDTGVVVTVESNGTNPEITSASSVYHIDWESETLNDKYTVDGNVLIERTVTYPKISSPECQYTDKINAALTTFCEKLVRIDGESKNAVLEKYTADAIDFEGWEFSCDFETGLYENYVSFVFDCGDYRGGADSGHYLKSIVFDLGTGETALSNEIFPEAVKVIKDHLTSVIRSSPDKYYSDSLEILETFDVSDCFYFSDAGLCVYVDPGILSPSVFGIIKAVIPYSSFS